LNGDCCGDIVIQLALELVHEIKDLALFARQREPAVQRLYFDYRHPNCDYQHLIAIIGSLMAIISTSIAIFGTLVTIIRTLIAVIGTSFATA
jgi:hypothetical protein